MYIHAGHLCCVYVWGLPCASERKKDFILFQSRIDIPPLRTSYYTGVNYTQQQFVSHLMGKERHTGHNAGVLLYGLQAGM